MWENTTPSTELPSDFCAGIGPLQLGVVLVIFNAIAILPVTCYLLLVVRVGFIGEGITPYLLSPLQQSPSQGGHAHSLHHQLVTEASVWAS